MSYGAKIREESPLIYNIMNEVASNFATNGLIALGASVSVSNTPKEAEEMGRNSAAVVLNLGTLSVDRAEALLIAGKAANEAGVPVIIDPIAVGASAFRTEVIYDILSKVKVAAICANAGEIAVLANAIEKTDSPDNALDENDPSIAAEVAKKYDTVVISTGETDVVTDGTRTTICKNGHFMLENITASGCLLTSVVAAFISVAGDNVYEASVEAIAGYTIAAELAMKHAKGPGSFVPAFIDELYVLNEETIETYKKLEQL